MLAAAYVDPWNLKTALMFIVNIIKNVKFLKCYVLCMFYAYVYCEWLTGY